MNRKSIKVRLIDTLNELVQSMCIEQRGENVSIRSAEKSIWWPTRRGYNPIMSEFDLGFPNLRMEYQDCWIHIMCMVKKSTCKTCTFVEYDPSDEHITHILSCTMKLVLPTHLENIPEFVFIQNKYKYDFKEMEFNEYDPNMEMYIQSYVNDYLIGTYTIGLLIENCRSDINNEFEKMSIINSLNELKENNSIHRLPSLSIAFYRKIINMCDGQIANLMQKENEPNNEPQENGAVRFALKPMREYNFMAPIFNTAKDYKSKHVSPCAKLQDVKYRGIQYNYDTYREDEEEDEEEEDYEDEEDDEDESYYPFVDDETETPKNIIYQFKSYE